MTKKPPVLAAGAAGGYLVRALRPGREAFYE
jgi:hypothetical protein